MANYDVDTIVIGSGAGGLTAGLALARAGVKVLVLEQHYVPGGWCHNFSKDGFTFCPGVHYIGRLGEGGETRQIYEGLGIGNDLIFFEQNPNGYEHCLIDGVRFDYPNNLQKLEQRLSQQFPKSQKGINDYLSLLRSLIDQLPKIFEVNSFKDALLVPYRTRHIGRYGLFSLKRILEARISDPHVRAILSVQCGDQGLPPGKTMMMLHAGLARHYDQGGFYPRGGGAAIVRAMVRGIKNSGGRVKMGMKVEKILTESKGSKRHVIGVRLADGEEIRCRNVVSNADPNKTFLGMVGAEHFSSRLKKRLGRTRYSISSLNLFLGLSQNPRQSGLDSGNIWYSRLADFDELFARALSNRVYENDEFDGLFISAPTLKDPTSFNGRGYTLEVVTFVGYEFFRKFQESVTEQRAEDYNSLKRKIIAMFLKTLERVIPGVSKQILFCDLGTPLTNNHYIDVTEGAVYGTEKNYGQIGPFAYRVDTEIEGLKLAGASTISHGVSGSSMSGLHAAAKILDCKWDSLLKPDGQSLQVYSAEDQSQWPKSLLDKIKPEEQPNVDEPLLNFISNPKEQPIHV